MNDWIWVLLILAIGWALTDGIVLLSKAKRQDDHDKEKL